MASTGMGRVAILLIGRMEYDRGDRCVGVRTVCLDTGLAYLHRSFLYAAVGTNGSGIRNIWVLYLRKCVPHSSIGRLAREQNIHHPDRPLPCYRRLPLQGDVLQLLRRQGRHAGPYSLGHRIPRPTRRHAFLTSNTFLGNTMQ